MKLTNVNKLNKVLSIINYIDIFDSRYVNFIHDLYKSDKIELISGHFCDAFQAKYNHFDLKDDKNWITYDTCKYINISLNEENKLICNVTIYNGNMLDGERTRKRFEASFLVKKILVRNSILLYFQNILIYKFKNHCENIFEAEEQLRKEKRIEEISKEILTF